MTAEKLLTPAELADALQVEVHWIYERARNDGMPHYRRGVVVRFDLAEVKEWMRQREAA